MKTTALLTALLAFSLPALGLALQGRGRDKTPPAAGQDDKKASDRAEAEKAQRQLASQFFSIADYDGNGWISFREAQQSLGIDKPRYLVYDKDRDGRVTEEEYVAVSIETWRRYGAFKAPTPNPNDPAAIALAESLAAGGTLEEEAEALAPLTASSLNELFGTVKRRVVRENTPPEPDQIIGPVPSYRRLDFDDDGGIGKEDLDLLIFGSGIEIRPNALIATFDADGDGKISEAEFYDSMLNPE